MIDINKLRTAKAEILRGRFDRAASLVMASRAMGVRLTAAGIEEALRLAEAGRLQEIPSEAKAGNSTCRSCRGL